MRFDELPNGQFAQLHNGRIFLWVKVPNPTDNYYNAVSVLTGQKGFFDESDTVFEIDKSL